MPTYSQTALPTDRLLLRPLREADASALFTIFSDPRVTRYLSHPAWTTQDSASQRLAANIQGMANGEFLCLGIERAADAVLIGECSLFNLHAHCRRAELGYTMGFDAWGHGYMHEALTALLGFGFGQMGLRRLEADIDPRNTASARSLQRLGFSLEGHLRERWIVEGEVSDTHLYG